MTSEADAGSPIPPTPPGGEAIEPPAGLGEIFSRTFSAVKRRFWTLLGINLVGVAVTTLWELAVLAVDALDAQSTSNESFDQLRTWTPLLWAIILLLSLLAQAIYLKVAFVSIAGADRLLAGERPTFSEMWRDSSGSLRRSIPLWILAILVVAGFALLFVVISSVDFGLSDDTALGRAVGVLYVLGLITFLLLFPLLTVYFFVRWVYVGPSLTLEKASGVESLRRSWRLTSRDFWRTFGYVLVFRLIELSVSGAAMIFGVGPGFPFDGQVGAEAGPDVSATEAFFDGLVSASTTTLQGGPLGWLIMLISNTLFVVFITAMYRDQQYRNSLRKRGINPENVGPMWQGVPPRQKPAEQPSMSPSSPSQPPAPPQNPPEQNPDNSD